ncbi:unnamed protein product [Nezara viridula]|uniref:Uncharacterized protein n=1 Tax=Nezara viridula TaxID=85310 RepID=A0A9P0MFH6_NEZVI|nr:unnamed protein product [Nezara viridula]
MDILCALSLNIDGRSERAEVCRSDSVKPELSEKTKVSLRRLSNFYGGGDISSPIHRSEQMWEESHSSVSVAKGCSGERRKRRFQALADMGEEVHQQPKRETTRKGSMKRTNLEAAIHEGLTSNQQETKVWSLQILFDELFETSLYNLIPSYSNIILSGDFNTNLMIPSSDHSHLTSLLQSLRIYIVNAVTFADFQ